jgi:hypothetical protein
MKLKIKEGTTSKLVRVFIQDSTSTTGAGKTGLVYNSAGLTAYYLPEGDATATSITLATMTVGTWASGGFKEVDSTNMPGVYEIGLPDAVIDSTSEGSVLVMLKGATNMVPVLLEIELDTVDYRNSAWSKLLTSANQIVISEVETTGTTPPTTTQFSTTLTSDDYVEGRTLIFTSGALIRLPLKITAASLDSGKLRLTVETHDGSAMPTTPSDGETFIII